MNAKKFFLNDETFFKRAAFLLFLIYAIFGLILFDDYGCGPDEGMERQTSLVNFRYAAEKLHVPLGEKNKTWLAYLPELHEYRDRYYGTALHFPLVIIESLFHFTLKPIQFYGMRHLYTFLNFYAGVLCFYFLLAKRFESRKYAAAGALMMVLFPRFFGESFYNNKDIIFAAWYMICLFLMDKWIRKINMGNTLLLAFAMALTINTRFNGVVFIAVFILAVIIKSMRSQKSTPVLYCLLTLLLMILIFYVITPNFWEDPIRTFAETLRFNMRHPNHGSEGNLFKGTQVDAARTLTFIPVWIAITVPTVFLVFSIAGTTIYLTDLLRKPENTELTDITVFVSGFGAVAFIILTHVTIYNGWRHCYFAYPCFVFFAVYLLRRLKGKIKIAAVCLLMMSFIYNGAWIVKNHPFEFVYFNPAVQGHAKDFSGDYWSISSRTLLEYIASKDPERMLKINHAYSQAGSINRGLLTDEQQNFIELTYDKDVPADYYIICRDDIPTVDIVSSDYEKVYSIRVDKDEIGAVFKRKK